MVPLRTDDWDSTSDNDKCSVGDRSQAWHWTDKLVSENRTPKIKVGLVRRRFALRGQRALKHCPTPLLCQSFLRYWKRDVMSAQAKDSIEVWIDNLPGNQQYERENAEGIGVDLIRRGNPAKRKRDADHGQSSQALPRQKARCLVDVSGNVMKRQSPRRKENRILHPHTPSKPKKDSVLQDPVSLAVAITLDFLP